MLKNTQAILPELILIVFAFYLTLRAASGKARREALFIESLVGAVTALLFLLIFGDRFIGMSAFYSLIELDKTAYYFRVFFIALAIFIIFMTKNSKEISDYLFGEFMIIILTMTSGMCFLASSADLIMIFFSLEWVSLSAYLLTAFVAHKRISAEAGIKYTLFGGIASAVMLFGISWLFGITGTLKLSEIPQLYMESQRAAILFALILITLGFAFKVAAVPLHFWAPDVYQAAPTPATTFFSIGPKAAGFAIIIRFFYYTMFANPDTAKLMESIRPALVTTISFLAAFTMTVGNLLALRQKNLKRLLAYSSISHAGFLLMGVAAFSDKGVQAILFYLFVYLLMNGGAFFVLNLTINRWGSEDIDDYQGMAWRGGSSALLALAMSIFLFSLAGLPPFAGFIGKWYLFAAAVEKEMYALVIVALVNIVIALYYYARILKAMYLVTEASPKKSVKISFGEGFWMGTFGILILYFGIFFSPFFNYLQTIIPR